MSYDTCPACGSQTVHVAPPKSFKFDGMDAGRGYDVFVGVQRGIVRTTPVTTLLCTTCGHFRQFVADPAKLAEVAATWPLVPPAPAG